MSSKFCIAKKLLYKSLHGGKKIEVSTSELNIVAQRAFDYKLKLDRIRAYCGDELGWLSCCSDNSAKSDILRMVNSSE